MNIDNLYFLDNNYKHVLKINNKNTDYKDWHVDIDLQEPKKNKMYVMIYTLKNIGGKNGISHQQNCININDNINCIDTPENSLLIYESSEILHSTTPLKDNEIRNTLITLLDT